MVDIAQQLVQSQRQNQPPSVAGVQARADRAEEVRVYVKGVKDAIVVSAQDLATAAGTHINFMRENPEAVSLYLPLILNNKFKEAKGFIDMATDGLTPLQRGAAATMALPLAGDITGLAADIEMYITDPESRNWVNYTLSGAGVAGGAATMSPAMVAIMPKIKRNIDAWHGSPHRLDSFSMANIGTGEGNQAFGHGLYFAEDQGIGEFYSGVLSKNKSRMKSIEKAVGDEELADAFDSYMVMGSDPYQAAEDYVEVYSERIDNAEEVAAKFLGAVDRGEIDLATDGYLYNVDLKVSPDDLLDWDAPLSEQSEAIQKALGRNDQWTTGESFYNLKSGAIDDQLTEKSGELYDFIKSHPKFNAEERNFNSREVISAWLDDKGIPGIRYYDGGSRAAGEGTRNFVIFDDSLVDIKTRNGEVLSPVQRQEAVTSMTSGTQVDPGLGYNQAEIAERYPKERGIGTIGVKKGREATGDFIGEDGKANYFISKDLSPEERAVQKARNAAQDDIKAGNYDPFFPLTERFNVDPSNYDIEGNTLTDSVYKTQKKRDESTEIFNTKAIKDRMKEAYEKGDSEMARDWYAMGQLEKVFIDELGEVEGQAMFRKRFAESMAATTGGADPTANLLTAAYTNYLEAQGVTDFPVFSTDIPHPQGGRYIGGNMKQANKYANTDAKLDASVSPKRFNFAANFMGDSSRATIDEQMSHLYDPKLNAPKKGNYGIMEQTLGEVAEEIGVDPMNFQDVAWAGSKGTDGKPMMEHINEAIERTARVTGKSRDDIVRDSLVNATHPLYGLATAGLLGTAAVRSGRDDQPGS